MRKIAFIASAIFVFAVAVMNFCGHSVSLAHASEVMTPVLMEVQDAPIPFAGSDGKTHLVYELGLRNFSSGNVTFEKVEILGDGAVISTLDAAEIATRLQPYGQREPAAVLAAGVSANLFIHVTLPENRAVPKTLVHRIHLRADAAPPGQQEMTETGREVAIDNQPVAQIGPPLHGSGYISADSCCDASRHTRAALPVNGRIWIAQRYAVDWEQVDDNGLIYHGPRAEDSSYTIYGKEVFAVADAKVVAVIDNLPSQMPGQYPTNISLDQADGNSVILDLGSSRYALYAHLQAGKITVHSGDTVKRGQVIGLVGNSGNSVAPHLHFHVMSTQTPLAANGLPYEIDHFVVTGATQGTAAFDESEAKGTPVAITAFSPPRQISKALPLDQLIVTFPK
jgi:hypothetical protein